LKSTGKTHCWNGIRFSLLTCLRCGLEQWIPSVAPSPDFYEREAEQISDVALVRHTVGSRTLGVNQLTFLDRHANWPGVLLDIGCGDGLFLSVCRELGFQVTGIDLDARALAVAERRGLSGLIRHATLEQFVDEMSGLEARFDVVTAFEVLEHQADPLRFVRMATRLLRPGGLFAGSVPNVARFKWLLPNHWDKPPYHFTRWTRDALRFFLERAGLVNVLVIDVGYGYYVECLARVLARPIKRLMLRRASAVTLRTLPVLEVARAANVGRGKLMTLWLAKVAKAAVLKPFVVVEVLLERSMGNGYFLYFEARTPK
jgi:2-polyprenyl-3-methyl-5-hydroxy-6-metoxy-1,4-benzoquinol methylase